MIAGGLLAPALVATRPKFVTLFYPPSDERTRTDECPNLAVENEIIDVRAKALIAEQRDRAIDIMKRLNPGQTDRRLQMKVLCPHSGVCLPCFLPPPRRRATPPNNAVSVDVMPRVIAQLSARVLPQREREEKGWLVGLEAQRSVANSYMAPSINSSVWHKRSDFYVGSSRNGRRYKRYKHRRAVINLPQLSPLCCTILLKTNERGRLASYHYFKGSPRSRSRPAINKSFGTILPFDF